jgi:hypothetical protein
MLGLETLMGSHGACDPGFLDDLGYHEILNTAARGTGCLLVEMDQ